MPGPYEDTADFTAMFWITGTTPGVRRAYRMLRRSGLNRYDANLVVAGICWGSGQGRAEIRRVRRPS